MKNNIQGMLDMGVCPDFLPGYRPVEAPGRDFWQIVDGIEHLILRGAEKVLALPGLQTVLIEVNEDFQVLATEVDDLLRSAGLALVERRHSDMFAGGAFENTYNQIWVRGSRSATSGCWQPSPPFKWRRASWISRESCSWVS